MPVTCYAHRPMSVSVFTTSIPVTDAADVYTYGHGSVFCVFVCILFAVLPSHIVCMFFYLFYVIVSFCCLMA